MLVVLGSSVLLLLLLPRVGYRRGSFIDRFIFNFPVRKANLLLQRLEVIELDVLTEQGSLLIQSRVFYLIIDRGSEKEAPAVLDVVFIVSVEGEELLLVVEGLRARILGLLQGAHTDLRGKLALVVLGNFVLFPVDEPFDSAR